MTDRKTTISTILLFVVLAFLVADFAGLIDISAIGKQAADTVTDTTGMVTVTRNIEWVCKNQYGGEAITSATLKIYDGLDIKETLTTDGTTGKIVGGKYTSGDILKALLVKGNAKCWYDVVIPKVYKADQDAVTDIEVELLFFDLDTSISIQLRDNLQNTYSSTDTLNFTTLGTDQLNIIVSGQVSADDKSFISSKDPLNKMDWGVICYAQLSGTNYENLAISGWHGSYPKGTTTWGYRTIPDDDVSMYKIGNLYELDGAFSFTLTVGKGGYTGDAADLVLYLQAYSDPSYHQQYGSFGPDTVAMASAFTLNLEA